MGQYQGNYSLCSRDFGSAKVNRSLDQPFIIHSLARLCSGGRQSSGGDLEIKFELVLCVTGGDSDEYL